MLSHCCTILYVFRAGDGTRTRDIKLGRLALYQLSYSREVPPRYKSATHSLCGAWWGKDSNLRRLAPADLQSALVGHLSTLPGRHRCRLLRCPRADGENRTRNRLITNQVLCQLSYVSKRCTARESKTNRGAALGQATRGNRAPSRERCGATSATGAAARLTGRPR